MTIDLVLAALILSIFFLAIAFALCNTDWSFKIFLALLGIDVLVAIGAIVYSAIRLIENSFISVVERWTLISVLCVSVLVLFYVSFGIRQGRRRKNIEIDNGPYHATRTKTSAE